MNKPKDLIETGVPWLQQIPKHWELSKFGFVLQERGEVNKDGKVSEVLSVLRTRGVIPYNEKGNIGNKKSEDITRYKIVRKGDIVMNSMNVIIGSVGLSEFEGCLSPVYYVLKKRSPKNNMHYLNYYCQTKSFQHSLTRLGNGILAHRMRIPMELLKHEPFPLPPLEEQNAIVRYLDYMDNLIKRYIRAKQKQISLLEEAKWALTHKAISQGVSTNKCIIDSDQDWLGAISVDANLKKLKCVCQINPSTNTPKFADNMMVEFVPMEKVNEKVGKITEFDFRPFSEIKTGFTSFKNYDLIFAKITPCMENGNCAIVSGLHHNIAYGSTEFIVFRANAKIIRVEFLHLLLRDKAFRIECEANMKGSAGQKRISPDFIGNIRVPVFSLEDQDSIIKFIYDFQKKVDQSINTLISEIKLLQEFLQVLIADTVTGKINIRKLDTDEYIDEDQNFRNIQIADPVLSELEGEIE